MPMLKVEGVTHWSIPVNDLEQSEKFYGELLGLEHKGRLGNATMSCFTAGTPLNPAVPSEGAAREDA